MVRSRGLEPPRVAPQRPQRCASTNSATTAHVSFEAKAPYTARLALCEAPNTPYMRGVMHKFPPVQWAVSDQPVPYEDALAFMEARARAIYEDGAPELVWFLEHPPLGEGIDVRAHPPWQGSITKA